MIAIGSLTTSRSIACGYGEAANYIRNQQLRSVEELVRVESYFPALKQVLPELEEVVRETSAPNWDGYDALPVATETFELAKDFLRSLPASVPIPSVGAEADGMLVFEWYHSPRRILSVSISPTGELHYAALIGASKSSGTEISYGKMPSIIGLLIRQVYNQV